MPRSRRTPWTGIFIVAQVVLVATMPGCLGGWTGDSASTAAHCDPKAPAFDAPSALGTSGASLLARYGGIHEGAADGGTPEFWQALLGAPIALPAAVKVELI